MRVRERFFVLLAPCILFSRCSWGSPHFVDGAWVCGRPPVSRRERADHSGYLPVKRSPLTNTDETREICSESVEFAQTFTKDLQDWEIKGDPPEKKLFCCADNVPYILYR